MERTEDVSDDSDGFIITTNKVRRRRPWEPEPQKDVDLTMRGGLGEGDVVDAHKLLPKRPTAKKVLPDQRQTSALEALKKRRDAALQAKKLSSEAVLHTEANRPSEEVAPEKDPPTPPPRYSDINSPTICSSPVRAGNLHSALKAQGTPAMETSILALANFKRRARQPSILRMVQQTSDNEDDDLDDFNPDDESTPLHFHITSELATGGKECGLRSSNPGRISSSRKRKLSTPEVQVLRSSPLVMPSLGADQEGSSPHSERSSLPEHIADTQEDIPLGQTEQGHEREPEIWSETMAPPRSSSSPASSPVSAETNKPPVKHGGRQQRSRNVHRHNQDFEDSERTASESEGDHRRKRASKKPSKPASLSTAKLQSLLPRRRRHACGGDAGQFDIPSSDENDVTMPDSDQDELELPASRHVTVARKTTSARTPVKSGSREARKVVAQNSAKKMTAAASSSKKATRTYGSRRVTSSDKENESTFIQGEFSNEYGEGPIEISIDQIKSIELAAASKKFAEVDKWEMEFESVDVGGGSSSPWR